MEYGQSQFKLVMRNIVMMKFLVSKCGKENPELAWGFKANFYNIMNNLEPHEGYYHLLKNLNNKYDYFVCTSNVDGYFFRAGYDSNKIYEVHGSVNNLQCMDKNCNIKNGIIPLKKEMVPKFDPNTFIATNLPKCKFCKKYVSTKCEYVW